MVEPSAGSVTEDGVVGDVHPEQAADARVPDGALADEGVVLDQELGSRKHAMGHDGVLHGRRRPTRRVGGRHAR